MYLAVDAIFLHWVWHVEINARHILLRRWERDVMAVGLSWDLGVEKDRFSSLIWRAAKRPARVKGGFMKRRLFALLPALAAIASGSRAKPDVWSTPQGRYVLGLRSELRRIGYFDDLREDWEAVERALREGCMYFEVQPSRQETDGGKLIFRVAPMGVAPIRRSAEISYDSLNITEWGR